MDALIKALTALLPFLAECPLVVRYLTVVWVALTGVLAIAVVVCQLWPTPRGIYGNLVMRIDSPPANSEKEVGQIEPVRFCSVHTKLHHYIIVMPTEAPARWIVDGPLKVSSNGYGNGTARLGSGQVGIGQRFGIAVLASKEVLREGPLPDLPPESHLSEYVTVKRVK